MHELGDSCRSGSVDVLRLCAAAYSAGRLAGYTEALTASGSTVARFATTELEEAMRAVDAVRETFGSVP